MNITDTHATLGRGKKIAIKIRQWQHLSYWEPWLVERLLDSSMRDVVVTMMMVSCTIGTTPTSPTVIVTTMVVNTTDGCTAWATTTIVAVSTSTTTRASRSSWDVVMEPTQERDTIDALIHERDTTDTLTRGVVPTPGAVLIREAHALVRSKCGKRITTSLMTSKRLLLSVKNYRKIFIVSNSQ